MGEPSLIRHPLALAFSGIKALGAAERLAERTFEGEKAKGLFAGNAAHSFLPLDRPPSALFGLLLGTLGHAFGWPFPQGGSQSLANALASYLESMGGEIFTNAPVSTVDDVPRTRAVLFDVTPRQLHDIAGEHFTDDYNRALKRYRYGPGVFKVDFALDGPIPWEAEGCRRGGNGPSRGHAGGGCGGGGHRSREASTPRGLSSPSPSRASSTTPGRTEGKHTVWAYCHVPNGSTFDMTGRIEAQIERFAPGFGDRILARHTAGTAELERWNPNLVGGDINGGYMDLQPTLHQAHAPAEPVLHPGPRPLHLLLPHAARRGRARHERLPGGQGRPTSPSVTGRGGGSGAEHERADRRDPERALPTELHPSLAVRRTLFVPGRRLVDGADLRCERSGSPCGPPRNLRRRIVRRRAARAGRSAPPGSSRRVARRLLLLRFRAGSRGRLRLLRGRGGYLDQGDDATLSCFALAAGWRRNDAPRVLRLAWSLAGISFAMYVVGFVFAFLTLGRRRSRRDSPQRRLRRVAGLPTLPDLSYSRSPDRLETSREPDRLDLPYRGLFWLSYAQGDASRVYELARTGTVTVFGDPRRAHCQGNLDAARRAAGLVYMILLFPDGRLPSRRWRPFALSRRGGR